MAEFSPSDIVLIQPPRARSTLVCLPYADGVPALMKGVGACWHRDLAGWSVPNERLAEARALFPRVVELVRVQQAVDAANGRPPPEDAPLPVVRSAGPASPVTEDWSEVGKLDTERQREAARALGCARKQGLWFAPTEEAAVRAREALAAVREAEAQALVELEEMKAEAKRRAEAERVRNAALEAQVRAVFPGRTPLGAENLEALVEVARAWPTARLQTVRSRLLDNRGEGPTVRVRTPEGREVYLSHLLRGEAHQISRRVQVVAVEAPRWPEGSRFRTTVTTLENGKAWTRDLAPYAPYAPTRSEDAAEG